MEMSPILGLKKKISTEAQKKILMEQFEAKKYLTKQEKSELAMLMNLNESTITNWYCHMRQKKAAEGMLSLSE